MSSNWDYVEKLADKHSSAGGIFVRLTNDGDSVIGVFCGEPFAREVVWTGEMYETYDKDIHTDKKPSLRIMLNFFVLEDGIMKIIEGGAMWFKDVRKIREKYGLEKWSFEIQRHGEAGNQKTTYTILPEEKLSDKQIETIQAAELHDLEELSGANAARPIGESPDAAKLVSRLKELPREKVQEFLRNFKITKVSDLKTADMGAANQLLAKLEADTEIDPFA